MLEIGLPLTILVLCTEYALILLMMVSIPSPSFTKFKGSPRSYMILTKSVFLNTHELHIQNWQLGAVQMHWRIIHGECLHANSITGWELRKAAALESKNWQRIGADKFCIWQLKSHFRHPWFVQARPKLSLSNSEFSRILWNSSKIQWRWRRKTRSPNRFHSSGWGLSGGGIY